MTKTISSNDDIIDSRDVIAYIEELEGRDDLDELEKAELDGLKEFAAQAEDYSPDWNHGATLIRDSYFQQYAQELAEDIGAISRDAKWPLDCIDWEKAAEELSTDYSAVEFEGTTYWIR